MSDKLHGIPCLPITDGVDGGIVKLVKTGALQASDWSSNLHIPTIQLLWNAESLNTTGGRVDSAFSVILKNYIMGV